ncbi:glycosyltransferase [Corallibacter sp.]|uniref:glycosyltransferase n=1 Tax=Corallibacter sp. TaxID=2038084 RepID=UPI003AB2462D
MENDKNSVWISWEDHRRSRELADSFGVQLVVLLSNKSRWIRYPLLSYKTIKYIVKRKPGLIFCQNPSIILAAVLISSKRLFGFKLVVDRHSNFKFSLINSFNLKWVIFKFLSSWTLRCADLTIVTNESLKEYCEAQGGKVVVLQDKIPTMSARHTLNYPDFFDANLYNIMVVATFDDDEPIEEIIDAARMLGEHYRIYVTGNYKKYFGESERVNLIESGVFLTGFVDEYEYQNTMFFSDAVVVLTKEEFVLNCGAYEALAMRKPYVISDTETLRGYFKKGCVYTELTAIKIANSIKYAVRNKEVLALDIESIIPQIELEWEERFAEIERRIDLL